MCRLRGRWLCELCWRAVIYPYRTVPAYRTAYGHMERKQAAFREAMR